MRIPIVSLFVLLLLFQNSYSQLRVMKLDKTAIPKGAPYSGRLVHAVRWSDSLGANIVIAAESGEIPSKGGDGDSFRDAYLYAYHYIVREDSLQLLWKVSDYSKDCPVDLKAHFVKNTFAVTDLNNDGKGEIWLMYKVTCQGDVSPVPMKIIMHEGGKKYAVRGAAKVQVSEKEYEGGAYTFDEAFKKGPEVFRTYAANLWKKNQRETWD